MIKHFLFAASAVMLLNACKSGAENENKGKTTAAITKDTHTQSNADSIKISHLDLDIQVNMADKKILGAATWTIANTNKLKTLKLDTYDLTIDSVLVDGAKVAHVLEAAKPHLGSALQIPITDAAAKVKIYYSTGAHARALQWLTPSQTNDKKAPFLYTQSESIYARSWIPCPDGPGIRYTYDARVQVPKGLLAIMSAENPQQKNDSAVYHFHMPMPIPAYLMALAVGDIVFKPVGDSTGVYAEPGMIDKVHYEFAELDRLVSTAEQLYGPYRWGRYDVVVLPPGFPIGGMENPKLTFCTPTVIAGDRSLVNLIAHELAHNWSGNLVTNATWNDFWLNEGFTVYFERRIMEQMMGKSYADMLWELGYQDLVTGVEEIGDTSRDTWLHLSLEGRDPDDGLNDIAYEKGSLFLRLIENNVGRARMDSFLNGYFASHAFKTITTEAFLTYLDEHLIKGDKALKEKLHINEWVYGPGIPASCPRADQERFGKVDAQRQLFEKGTPAAQLLTKDWTTHEWLQFLRKLPKTLTAAQMADLDKAFKFTQTGNSEIADLWFVWSVRTGYKPAYKAMEQFLSRVGRRKFLMPLYSEMMKTPENQAMAKTLYTQYKQNYHPIAQETLDKLVLGK